MPQPLAGLIQTIVSLRDLQLREAAQRLQEQQLGISQGQEHIAGQSGFQEMLKGMSNPQAMLPNIGQFAGTTGLDPATLTAMVQGTPPSASTTKGAAVAAGAQPSMNTPAASQELTGMTPGQMEMDRFKGLLTHQASDYYSGLTPEAQQGFQKGVLSQVATGQDIGSATMSQIMADELGKMPPGQRRRLVEIGKGLAPSADQAAQLQLGWANERRQQREQETALALEDVKVHAGMAQARRELEKDAFKELNSLVEKRAELINKMTSTSATLTEEGKGAYVDQFNAFNAQIRAAAPGVYGPRGTMPIADLPKGSTTGATGVLPFLGAAIQGKLTPPNQ